MRRVAGRGCSKEQEEEAGDIVLVSIFRTAAASSSPGNCAPEVRKSVCHLSVTGQASDLRRTDCYVDTKQE